jgi:hypothetical protein
LTFEKLINEKNNQLSVREMNMVRKSKILVIFASVFMLMVISQAAIAHDPSDMDLEYNFFTDELSVTITHSVAAPNEHYIESVEIFKNDVSYLLMNYTSQPSLTTFTYTYDVEAQDGDRIRVLAICSISGSITREITLDEPAADDIVVTIEPMISSINENSAQIFTVTTKAAGAPLDDVTLDIKVKLGSASSYQRVGPGLYNFTYTAPDVNQALSERIDVTAEKDGYKDGDVRLDFTVNEFQNTGGDCPPTLDGVIETGEYDFTASFGGGKFKLHWKLENNTINMAMEGKTTGWVAIGFDPENRMKGADMVFGWVTSAGDATAVDAYATGPTGPHPKDTDQGGTSDILCFGGMESGGKTIIEFKRLLITNDTKRDKTIPTSGELTIIWALGPNDDFDSQHSERGAGKIDFGEGTSEEIDIPSFWIIHASLMILGFIFMLTGMIIARFYKDTMWWFKIHKRIAPAGSVLSIAGLVMGLIMVSMGSGEHFRIPHAIVGLIAVIFAIITPTLGLAQFKIKKNKKKIRAAHRWSGRITITLMFLNILFGLSVVGII